MTETVAGSAADSAPGPGIFSAQYRLVTLGILSIMFLIAFENIAVTTIMPVVSKDLNGAALYAVAFAGPLAVGVVGMVVAGNWSDRSGPTGPLFASVAVFAIGLVIAGTAQTMGLLVTGRIVYGLAGGGAGVALFVIIARVFPENLQTKMFGALAAAWVFPALVGPAIAGIVADTVGWPWVFLGVVVLVAVAVVMIIPVMRGFENGTDHTVSWSVRRILCAIVLALAVLGLGLSADLEVSIAIRVLVALAALAVAVIAARPLLPVGSLRARPGLPSVILLRTICSGAYFGAEVYVPYLLTTQFHLTPSLAGLSLTGAGIAWGAASVLQGRVADRLRPSLAALIGVAGMLIAILAALATAFFDVPVWIAIVGWAVGGAGMGTLTPRLSVQMFSYSTPSNQGFNSSALSIADAVGPGITLAVAGILFGYIGTGGTTPFVGVFLFVVIVAALGLTLAGRAFDGPAKAAVAPAAAGNPLP